MKPVTFQIPDTRTCFQCGAVAGRCKHTPAYPTTRDLSMGQDYSPNRRDSWKQEDITTLRRMWANGASARRIACHLNTTHGAVAGKVKTLGLVGKQGEPA